MPTIYSVYTTLRRHYGAQTWWPADSDFEVMAGAILTQNISWTNVEKALDCLKDADCLSCDAILTLTHDELAALIKSSGYFNVKAKRLKNYCFWYAQQKKLASRLTDNLRDDLLSINGVGPETADDILLYAFQRPVFVIDAYTRRLFSRLDLISRDESYEVLRTLFEKKLVKRKNKVELFNEYHALIVNHAKHTCRARNPDCADCCLRTQCNYNQ
ncbi:Endonuclease III [hydrothermal vent metagenome]|uniref:Endonuclease III n=1 Tax=hydrothermal vent metagenome TaxID=652676 RepID=A0A3B0ZBV9_9ZZZZ